jgi:hypothetical protein
VIASLPMYWRAENAAAWGSFWALVQSHCALKLPDLTPADALPQDLVAHWRDPTLMLSMTCGYPYRTALIDDVTYVGTLDFGLDEQAGFYFSQVLAREAEITGPVRLAVNSFDSQSGWACVRDQHPHNPVFDIASIFETGSHAASLSAVADGTADVAYIDAVSWRLFQKFDANAAKVALIGRTSATPGLPLITARGRDPDPLRDAIQAAIASLDGKIAGRLGALRGMAVIEPSAYLAVPDAAPALMPR